MGQLSLDTPQPEQTEQPQDLENVKSLVNYGNVSGTEINLKPTQGMVTEAKRYKAWKEEGKAGGTQVAAVKS